MEKMSGQVAWRGITQAIVVSLALFLSGCTGTAQMRPVVTAPGPVVWVMSNGWHTEIVLRRADIPPDLIPEITDYPKARYFAFGWGDARYYPAREPGLELAILALAAPTPAVVHLTAIPSTPKKYYRDAEVLGLPITARGLEILARYIDESFDRGPGARAKKIEPGLYPESGFYPATGRFHLFNTCNTWTSRGLMRAGLAVGKTRAIQAEALMRELRPIAAGTPPRDDPELGPYYYR